jgi:hypothetical protein
MLRKIIFLLTILLVIPTSLLSADLTPGEKRRIGSSAEEALREVISLWKDGKYEELYEYGYRTNQVSLSKDPGNYLPPGKPFGTWRPMWFHRDRSM